MEEHTMNASTERTAEIFYLEYMDKHEERRQLETIQEIAQGGDCAYIYHVDPWDEEDCPFIHYIVSNQPMGADDLRLVYELDQQHSAREALSHGETPYEVWTQFNVCKFWLEDQAREMKIDLSPNWLEDADKAVNELAAKVNSIKERAAAEIKAAQDAASF
jgi:hypothetical protein